MIDFSFIQALEGNTCEGYVPDVNNSQSGVTIGCGFDIGARSKDELCAAFPDELATKLVPYAGLKNHDAVAQLQVAPLHLSEDEVTQINRHSKHHAVQRLQAQWNACEDAYIPFEALPDVCQTVVASVAFQYGTLLTRTPNFWRQVTRGDWRSALNNLRRFGDRYSTRRNKEADLLESWLESI
ncbi:pesticin C-terminus-like muramidase [Alteromonas sp. a30]|uniref:pesticin C-terminus-like muramidase n=1 Tax=Alteromonas sp. a30 TaxID=2730917 RepID=UPI002280A4B3|nr:pesticin C-terminus-like muramidase [Alteromonas sp. a30]MCY7296510.1 peptidase [Alteromonas sp. a30]